MPSPFAMPDLQPYIAQLGGAVAFVAAVLLTVLKLNKSASKNQTEIGEDKASQNILAVALRQRDEAIKAAEVAWAQRTSDAVRVAELETEKRFWDREKVELGRDYMQLEALCRRAARRLQQLDPHSASLLFPSAYLDFDDAPHLGHLGAPP